MSIPTLFDKMRENRRRFKPFVPEKILPGDFVLLKSSKSPKEVLYILDRKKDSGEFLLSDGFAYKRGDFRRCTPYGVIAE